MPITRRQFLRRSGLAAGGVVLGPGLFRSPFVADALASTIGDRYLVVLYLDGGNDGLHTVVPADGVGGLRAFYEGHRKVGTNGLRLAPADLLVSGGTPMIDPATGATLGLHPGLGGLFGLYEQGRVAIVQGCGSPEPSLSHDEATTAWETANPLGVAALGSTGWVGRHLAGEYGGTDIPGVAIGDSVPGELRQTATSVLTISRLTRFGFPYDDWNPADDPAKRTAFLAAHGLASGSAQSKLGFIGSSGTATLVASESYPPLHDLYEADRPGWSAAYGALGTSTARELREVAKVIHGVEQGVANVHARFFQVRNGGYDTHADQGGGAPGDRHYDLHAEVGGAVETFFADLDDMGIAHKVCMVVWSEFSRRPSQNQNGTDHGTQGPMFVIGGAVSGGIYGNHPNIDPNALDGNGNTVYSQAPGDAFRSTDFRDVYGTILKHWLNMAPATILASVLPPDVGPPASYWTAPDFDLGFLP